MANPDDFSSARQVTKQRLIGRLFFHRDLVPTQMAICSRVAWEHGIKSHWAPCLWRCPVGQSNELRIIQNIKNVCVIL